MTTAERVIFLEGVINRIKKDQELLEKTVDDLWSLIIRQIGINESVLELLGIRWEEPDERV